MAEIIPPANPLVPLAAPPDRANYRGRDERPPAWHHRQRSFHEELAGPNAALSYSRDDNGTLVRAAKLGDDGVVSAVLVDVERTRLGPRTTVAVVRETMPAAAFPGSLLQPGRLVNILV